MNKTGIENGKFKVCPDSPNCVSTMEHDSVHGINPLVYSGERDAARLMLLSLLKDYPGCAVKISGDEYIHCVFTTRIMRFKDDVEFYLPKTEKTIHMRSASRVGYSDMGVNRKRIEMIRADFEKALKK